MANVLTVFYSRKGENHFPDGIRSIEKGTDDESLEISSY